MLRHGELGEPNGDEVLAYTPDVRLPGLELRVGERILEVHIDSGAPSGIVLPKTLAEELEWLEEPRVVGRARTVNNDFEVWRGRLRGEVRLGGHAFVDPFVVLDDQFPQAVLGYEVLRELALSSDQAEHRLRLARAPAASAGAK